MPCGTARGFSGNGGPGQVRRAALRRPATRVVRNPRPMVRRASHQEPPPPGRYQRSGCRHTEYHRPRFFSFHCGSAHSRFSSSGDIVEPLVAGLSSEQPPAVARTASINNAALTRPPPAVLNPIRPTASLQSGDYRTRMRLQQSNKIIIAARPRGVGWTATSPFPTRAQSSAALSRRLNRRGWRSAISAIIAW